MATVNITRLKDRDTAETFLELVTLVPKPIVYVTPSTGATVISAVGTGTMTVVPAANLATLTIIMPPGVVNEDVFKITTTKDIISLSVQGSGSDLMAGTSGGPIYLTANGSVSWHYRAGNSSWYPA